MKKEDAVSEVVGIMIMLTITVVLAAVVALVATSAVGDTEKPLTAEITAVGVSGDGVTFELISGEPFALSDIRAYDQGASPDRGCELPQEPAS